MRKGMTSLMAASLSVLELAYGILAEFYLFFQW